MSQSDYLGGGPNVNSSQMLIQAWFIQLNDHDNLKHVAELNRNSLITNSKIHTVSAKMQ